MKKTKIASPEDDKVEKILEQIQLLTKEEATKVREGLNKFLSGKRPRKENSP